MSRTNTVEINGKLYDARTGQPIGSDERKIIKSALKKRSKTVHRGTVEGFRAPQKSIAIKSPEKKVVNKTTTRSEASNIKRRPKQSVTLHRGVVRHPEPISINAAPSQKVQSSALKEAQNPAYDRAKKIKRSPLISRFGYVSESPDTITTPAHEADTKEARPKQTIVRTTKDSQTKKAATPPTAIPSNPVPTPARTKRAITKKHPAKKMKFAGIGTAVLATCLIAAYVAYLNIPTVSMRVAAYQAGFAASLPSYRPTGYSFRGPIKYHPGQVTINFQAADPAKMFSLSQQETTWDSTALLENYITKHTAQYVTYQDRGLTIYIYDGSNAAWVNGGKMYTVNAENTHLDTDQILRLATSM